MFNITCTYIILYLICTYIPARQWRQLCSSAADANCSRKISYFLSVFNNEDDAHISFQSCAQVNYFKGSLVCFSALSVLNFLCFIWGFFKEGSLIVKQNSCRLAPLFVPYMKETQRRKRTIMSSLNAVSTDQLWNKMVARYSPPPFFTTSFWTDT